MNSPPAHAGFCSRVQFSAPEENGCAPLMFRGGIDDAKKTGPRDVNIKAETIQAGAAA